MEEGSTSEHHRQLTGVVGVVVPALVLDVPCMEAAREPHQSVTVLTPHSTTKQQFFRSLYHLKLINPADI